MVNVETVLSSFKEPDVAQVQIGEFCELFLGDALPVRVRPLAPPNITASEVRFFRRDTIES